MKSRESIRLLDTNRSLTCVGTGGVGKILLYLEIFSGVIERFQDGVWFIELGSLFEPDLVVTEILYNDGSARNFQ
jgi:predicted ATPase